MDDPDPDVIASLDVLSPEYDAYEIARALRTFPNVIVGKERKAGRQADFANARESILRDLAKTRLGPHIKSTSQVEVECYVSSCEITVPLADESHDAINAALLAMQSRPYLYDGIQPMEYGEPGKRKLWFGLLYSRAQRDHRAFTKRLQEEARSAETVTNAP